MAQGDRERRNSTAGNPCSFTTAFVGAHGAGHQYCRLKSSANHNSNWFANQQPNHSANLAILQGHSSVLPNHSSVLPNHSSVLPNHSSILPNHSQYLPNHTWRYLTHSGMIGRKCHNQEGERIQVGSLEHNGIDHEARNTSGATG